jgi:2-keto-4-pentenoate hydratase/2-oxohepta-3-ene-1,7-dioic acid hydratase in catechol pathway
MQTETRAAPDAGWAPSRHLVALGYGSPFVREWDTRHARRYEVRLDGSALPFQPLSMRRVSGGRWFDVSGAVDTVGRLSPSAAALVRNLATVASQTVASLLPDTPTPNELEFTFANPLTLRPSGAEIAIPQFSGSLDYELSLGFLISEPLLDATAEQAQAAITALAAVCQFTTRDLRYAEEVPTPTAPKQFTGSLSATAVKVDDQLAGLSQLTGSVEINGDRVAKIGRELTLAALGEIVAVASVGEPLSPGELFMLPLLPGGSGAATGHRLRRGDRVELELDGIGRIEHAIS